LGLEPQYKEAYQQVSQWNLICSVSGIDYFPEERVKYLAREAEKELKQQAVNIISAPLMSDDQLLNTLQWPNKTTTEEKNLLAFDFKPEPYWKDRMSGAHGDIYFQTTMDRAEHLIARMNNLADDAGIKSDRKGFYIQPQLGGRCCHIECTVEADKTDSKDMARVSEFCDQSAAPMIAEGAFFSRPHGSWSLPAMKKASSSYDIFKKMKQIFDPDGILAPGRLVTGGDHHA